MDNVSSSKCGDVSGSGGGGGGGCVLCQEELGRLGNSPGDGETALSVKNLFGYLQVDVGKLKRLQLSQEEESSSSSGSGLRGNTIWDEEGSIIASMICKDCAYFANLFGHIYEDYEKAVTFMTQCIQQLEIRMTGNFISTPGSSTHRGGGGDASGGRSILKAEVLRKCQLKLNPESNDNEEQQQQQQHAQENQSSPVDFSSHHQDQEQVEMSISVCIPETNSKLDEDDDHSEMAVADEEEGTSTEAEASSSSTQAAGCPLPPPPPPQSLSPSPVDATPLGKVCCDCATPFRGPKSQEKKHLLCFHTTKYFPQHFRGFSQAEIDCVAGEICQKEFLTNHNYATGNPETKIKSTFQCCFCSASGKESDRKMHLLEQHADILKSRLENHHDGRAVANSAKNPTNPNLNDLELTTREGEGEGGLGMNDVVVESSRQEGQPNNGSEERVAEQDDDESDNSHDESEGEVADKEDDNIQEDGSDYQEEYQEEEENVIHQDHSADTTRNTDMSGEDSNLKMEDDDEPSSPPPPRLEPQVVTHPCDYCPLRLPLSNLTRHMVRNHTIAYFREKGSFVGRTDDEVDLEIWNITQEGRLPEHDDIQDSFLCSFCEGGAGAVITGDRKFHLLTQHVAIVESRLGGSERGGGGGVPNSVVSPSSSSSTQGVPVPIVRQEDRAATSATPSSSSPLFPEVMDVEVPAHLIKEMRDHLLVSSHFLKNRDYYNTSRVEPPYTYSFLMRKAIRESPDNKLSPTDIYKWFLANFLFFRKCSKLRAQRLRKTINDMLGKKPGFVRVARGGGPGRQGIWMVKDRDFFRPGTRWARQLPEIKKSKKSKANNVNTTLRVKTEHFEEGNPSVDSNEEVVPPPMEIQQEDPVANNQEHEPGTAAAASSSSNNNNSFDELLASAQLSRFLKQERVVVVDHQIMESDQMEQQQQEDYEDDTCEMWAAPSSSTMYLEHLRATKEEFDRVRDFLRKTEQQPDFSFEFLITQAMSESADKQLDLTGICNWFTENLAYYRACEQGKLRKQLGSILSSCKTFVRVEAGRVGGAWRVDPREFYKPRTSACIAMKFKPMEIKKRK